MLIKESKMDIIDDLKRMLKTLNEHELDEIFLYLIENEKNKSKNYIVVKNEIFNKFSNELNEAYSQGFKDSENDHLKENKIKKEDDYFNITLNKIFDNFKKI